jgi:uncharacterized protein (TIGR03067 family)
MNLATGLLALCLTVLPAADEPADANKADLKAMQGDWNAASQVVDGQKVGDDEAQILFRTVKDDNYTVLVFDKPIGKGTFTIDATKKVKTIDARPASAPKDSPPMLGIYEIDGDTFRTCFAPAGKDRPKDFECKAGSGHTLIVWKREKK